MAKKIHSLCDLNFCFSKLLTFNPTFKIDNSFLVVAITTVICVGTLFKDICFMGGVAVHFIVTSVV